MRLFPVLWSVMEFVAAELASRTLRSRIIRSSNNLHLTVLSHVNPLFEPEDTPTYGTDGHVRSAHVQNRRSTFEQAAPDREHPQRAHQGARQSRHHREYPKTRTTSPTTAISDTCRQWYTGRLNTRAGLHTEEMGL